MTNNNEKQKYEITNYTPEDKFTLQERRAMEEATNHIATGFGQACAAAVSYGCRMLIKKIGG